MQGLIFSIKRYSVHDGPGIRVTFFMKGCPLGCRWCHNPEGISRDPERTFTTKKLGEKEYKREEAVGRYYTVEELLRIIDREKIFIGQSGGGVTFSGGEPLLQPDFLKEALKACRARGFHTAVDTSGYAPAENFRSVVPFTDLFLFDLKHLDEKKHTDGTGVSNEIILKNLVDLLSEQRAVWLRIPVIPGYNDDPQHITRLIDFIRSAATPSLRLINLLPFHTTGSSKYKRFGLPYHMEGVSQPPAERMKDLKRKFEETGIKVKIGG